MSTGFSYLPAEEDVLTINYLGLRVTTHRVRWEEQGWGYGNIHSFLLSELDSCQASRLSAPWLIVLAVLVALATAAVAYFGKLEGGYLVGALVVGGVVSWLLVMWYLFSRTHTLLISTRATILQLSLGGVDADYVRGVIDTIERAKNNYLSEKRWG